MRTYEGSDQALSNIVSFIYLNSLNCDDCRWFLYFVMRVCFCDNILFGVFWVIRRLKRNHLHILRGQIVFKPLLLVLLEPVFIYSKYLLQSFIFLDQQYLQFSTPTDFISIYSCI